MTKLKKLLVTLVLLVGAQIQLFAQGTTFTYQGRLNTNAVPASGLFDFEFSLSNAPSGGSQVGSTITQTAIGVTNGLFITTLNFGAVFTGNAAWLAISVRSNGVGSYTAMTPLQELNPTPYAIFADTASNVSGPVSAAQLSGDVPSANLDGTYGGAVTLNNANNNFSGNGANLTNVNAAELNGLKATNVWQLGGNNVSAGQFLGSTNSQAVELWANNARALRLEPGVSGEGAPNVIGGSQNNFVSNGVVGATIGGGGAANYGGNIYTNCVMADFGSVGGGAFNIASGPYATVSGGVTNQASGEYATVSGGYENVAGDQSATVGGGQYNQANVFGATISGGAENYADGYGATVGGGEQNYANSSGGANATVSGGYQNDSSLQGDTVGGGEMNGVTGPDATVGGGYNNLVNGYYGTVGGGVQNWTTGAAATIGGGENNNVNGSYATVGGGNNNLAWNTGATVPGGYYNSASGQDSFAAGTFARAANDGAFVWADFSSLSPFASSAGNQFLIRAQGGVGVGTNNPSAGLHVSTGGNATDPQLRLDQRTSGDYARLRMVNQGGSGATWDIAVGGSPNTINFFASPSAGGTGTNILILQPNGNASLWGTLAQGSDRAHKDHIKAIDPQQVLAKVAGMPISEWDYTTEPGVPHLGPMAQDFYAAFNLGQDNKHITTIDEGGVALAAIQGLDQKLNEKDTEIKDLKQSVEELKKLVQSVAEKE